MKTKEELPECPVATAVALIGGKWKLLIIRNLRDYGENPPRVEYGLTELGRQMLPVMDSLATFGAHYKTAVS